METKSESNMKNALRIDNWSEISEHGVFKYIKLLPTIEKSLHFDVLKQAPELLKKAGNVMEIVKNVINENDKLSSETKQAYNQLIIELGEMLKKRDLSDEEQHKIFEELVKVASFVNTANKRDEALLGKIIDGVFITTIVGILLTGVLLGAKSLLISAV